jgi:myosin-5
LLEKEKGATLPPLRNPPKLENAEDLTTLSYLNEPSGKEHTQKKGVI